MRTIAVVTGSRADFGIYLPILRAIEDCPDLKLRLMVCGTHLAHEFGHTVDVITAEGFVVDDRIETLMASDTPEGIAKSMGMGVIGFSQAFGRQLPDLLLLLGDRTEMLAAAVAALPFAVPTAHIHGGEATQGLIDEAIRHSLTKMSHLHFVATETYGRRVVQMGESPDRVYVFGAPGLDNINTIQFLGIPELQGLLGMDLSVPPVLCTFHPVTLDHENSLLQMKELLAALETVSAPVIMTYPNGDTNSRVLIQAIEDFVQNRPDCVAVRNLGLRAYFSLMRHAAAMVGNSSSGIIEAASFHLPVINIGARQRGRVHGVNVIDVETDRQSIAAGLARVLHPDFKSTIATMTNPYGDGKAAERIVEVLRTHPLERTLLEKKFYDMPDGMG